MDSEFILAPGLTQLAFFIFLQVLLQMVVIYIQLMIFINLVS